MHALLVPAAALSVVVSVLSVLFCLTYLACTQHKHVSQRVLQAVDCRQKCNLTHGSVLGVVLSLMLPGQGFVGQQEGGRELVCMQAVFHHGVRCSVSGLHL